MSKENKHHYAAQMEAFNMLFHTPEVEKELLDEYVAVPIDLYEELVREETELQIIYNVCKGNTPEDFMAFVTALMAIRENHCIQEVAKNA